MNRAEIAEKLAAEIDASEDYAAKVWVGGGYVRVYLSTMGRDVGCVAIGRDGVLDFKSLGNGKHAVRAQGFALALKPLGLEVWRSEYSFPGVTDEFADVKPTSPAQRKEVDANTAAQIRLGTLESFDR